MINETTHPQVLLGVLAQQCSIHPTLSRGRHCTFPTIAATQEAPAAMINEAIHPQVLLDMLAKLTPREAAAGSEGNNK